MSSTTLKQSPEKSLIALMVLSILGIAISSYLTTVHYANIPLICTQNSLLDCAKVVTSIYSVIPSTTVPITVPGLLFFCASLLLALRQWQRPTSAKWYYLHLSLAALGLLTVFYLVFVEIMELHTICPWCTSVHLTILLIFLLTIWRLPTKAVDRPPKTY